MLSDYSTLPTFFYGITLCHKTYSVLLLGNALWLFKIDDANFSFSTSIYWFFNFSSSSNY